MAYSLVLKSLALAAIVLGILAAVFARTRTPPFRDASGRIADGSIAEERMMTLGGSAQYVLIRGRDRSAPLLMFLHGGPGYSAMPINRMRNSDLENDFVFVNWDQRGAGYSYDAAKDPATLTLDQITRDLDDLIDALLAEFAQSQVMLVGHSWGSLVGVDYVSWHPEKVAAYIGVSQFSNTPASDAEGYEWTLQKARERKNAKVLAALEHIGPPPYTTPDKMSVYHDAINKMGGVWFDPKPGYRYVLEYLRAPEFAWPGLINLARGGTLSTKVLFSTVFHTNAAAAYRELRVPVFFVEGRFDHVVSPRQAEIYFDDLIAPEKEFIWFERSAHMPNWEEPERFHAEIRRIARQVGLVD